jgi:hypothetical protein
MPIDPLPTEWRPDRLLTAPVFYRLADVPPEIEWFANLTRSSSAGSKTVLPNAETAAALSGLRTDREAKGRPLANAFPKAFFSDH